MGTTTLPCEEHRFQNDAGTVSVFSRRLFNTRVLVICGWSLLETLPETGVSDSPTRLLALSLLKLVVIGTGVAAVSKVRFARETFSFVCSASLLAIAPGLLMEFKLSFSHSKISCKN
ncbi:hypothetical protein [Paraburkholderia oxyphila]|uniref:hypothetical protein n=1 Tax=Paraburkholderia oxyphila TaxID=614212 RepID=UPI0012EED63F|nr:hypothetical protein [Paraburkholderia oxyphila]